MAENNSLNLIKSLIGNLSEEKRNEFFNKLFEKDEENIQDINPIKNNLISKEEALKQLSDSYLNYNETGDFKIGQYLKWKKGMKNRYKPEYGMPVVVIDLLKNPIVSEEEESYSPYFREKIDIVIGLIDDDDEFVFIHCDKNRFEPFELKNYDKDTI